MLICFRTLFAQMSKGGLMEIKVAVIGNIAGNPFSVAQDEDALGCCPV
jgi:hypothetical protein